MVNGLRSQIYQVSDLEAAKDWYAQLLGKPPYFDEPFYVGLDVGGGTKLGAVRNSVVGILGRTRG